ncbi:unnamed protein product [Vitrella brassicaformis CCMP3155]|uniref:subtilisin n=7 Tax=Vitrella brassicaformis TaxID=1169539 RepID=A0A0G4EC14_VITBC|nr:unnamed protein product [Vitrella brassicaformis CCMP3155]|eukprot:CEL93535.1 unnamed protein product [Vitrella brassicaformis CCMP3155]
MLCVLLLVSIALGAPSTTPHKLLFTFPETLSEEDRAHYRRALTLDPSLGIQSIRPLKALDVEIVTVQPQGNKTAVKEHLDSHPFVEASQFNDEWTVPIQQPKMTQLPSQGAGAMAAGTEEARRARRLQEQQQGDGAAGGEGVDRVVPNDPLLGTNGMWWLRAIQAYEGWAIHKGNNGIIVAIVDSGLDYLHPDLIDNIWHNPDEIPDGIDNDGNGYIDDLIGYDFINDDNDTMSSNDHGTHVAGIVGAVANNSEGMAGVLWKPRLMGLQVMDELGGGRDDAYAAAWDYAVQNGAKVSTASFGWRRAAYFMNAVLRRIIRRLGDMGHILITAAGNDNAENDSRSADGMVSVQDYPCGFFLDNVICVAATVPSDGVAGFSNVGKQIVDVGAPGWEILSTYGRVPQALSPSVPLHGQGYATASGTSMAAPVTAGVAALLMDYLPHLTPSQVKRSILASADYSPYLQGLVITNARVNAYRALKYAVGLSECPVLSFANFPAATSDLNGEWTLRVSDLAESVNGTGERVDTPDTPFIAATGIAWSKPIEPFGLMRVGRDFSIPEAPWWMWAPNQPLVFRSPDVIEAHHGVVPPQGEWQSYVAQTFLAGGVPNFTALIGPVSTAQNISVWCGTVGSCDFDFTDCGYSTRLSRLAAPPVSGAVPSSLRVDIGPSTWRGQLGRQRGPLRSSQRQTNSTEGLDWLSEEDFTLDWQVEQRTEDRMDKPGPPEDHTQGSGLGRYALLDLSFVPELTQDVTAPIPELAVSPHINRGGPHCVEMWVWLQTAGAYRMQAMVYEPKEGREKQFADAAVGDVVMDHGNATDVVTVGEGSTEGWRRVVVQLRPKGPFRFAFRATLNERWVQLREQFTPFMAIDDILVLEGWCSKYPMLDTNNATNTTAIPTSEANATSLTNATGVSPVDLPAIRPCSVLHVRNLRSANLPMLRYVSRFWVANGFRNGHQVWNNKKLILSYEPDQSRWVISFDALNGTSFHGSPDQYLPQLQGFSRSLVPVAFSPIVSGRLLHPPLEANWETAQWDGRRSDLPNVQMSCQSFSHEHDDFASDVVPCDFEFGFCGYQQDATDDFNWSLEAAGSVLIRGGQTFQSDSTPTSSSGNFAYIDTAFFHPYGARARLISPAHEDTTAPLCLEFFYWVARSPLTIGSEIVDLSVFIMDADLEPRDVAAPNGTSAVGGSWIFSKEDGKASGVWRVARMQIPPRAKPFKVVFEARQLRDWGEMALDDIALYKGTCPDAVSCSFDGTLCGYLNSFEDADGWGLGPQELFANLASFPLRGRPAPVDAPTVHQGGEGEGTAINGYVWDTYLWTWANNVLGNAMIQSPPVIVREAGTKFCLEFYFYVKGNDLGNLVVYKFENDRTDKLWELLGSDVPKGGSENWQNARTRFIASSDFLIYFEAQRKAVGAAVEAMAIDDVQLREGGCLGCPYLNVYGFASHPDTPIAEQPNGVWEVEDIDAVWPRYTRGSFYLYFSPQYKKWIFDRNRIAVDGHVASQDTLGNRPTSGAWTYYKERQATDLRLDIFCSEEDACASVNATRDECPICLNQEDGTADCRCHPGYTLVNGTCQDVDECLEAERQWEAFLADPEGAMPPRMPCPEGAICNNTPGTFECQCPETLILGEDGSGFPACINAPVDGVIRLVGSPEPNQGLVQVYVYGEWRPFCGASFDVFIGDVACRSLGMGVAVEFYRGTVDPNTFKDQDTIWIDQCDCRGSERWLPECTNIRWTLQKGCRDNADTWLVCTGKSKEGAPLLTRDGDPVVPEAPPPWDHTVTTTRGAPQRKGVLLFDQSMVYIPSAMAVRNFLLSLDIELDLIYDFRPGSLGALFQNKSFVWVPTPVVRRQLFLELDESDVQAFSRFVESGGALVVQTEMATLVNYLFNWTIAIPVPSLAVDMIFCAGFNRTTELQSIVRNSSPDDREGQLLRSLPMELPDLDVTVSVSESSLPEGAIPLYGCLGFTPNWLKPMGKGFVYGVGWDFYRTSRVNDLPNNRNRIGPRTRTAPAALAGSNDPSGDVSDPPGTNTARSFDGSFSDVPVARSPTSDMEPQINPRFDASSVAGFVGADPGLEGLPIGVVAGMSGAPLGGEAYGSSWRHIVTVGMELLAPQKEVTFNSTVSCNDGRLNGDEFGIDCGGSCPACTCEVNVTQTSIQARQEVLNSTNTTSGSVPEIGKIAVSDDAAARTSLVAMEEGDVVTYEGLCDEGEELWPHDMATRQCLRTGQLSYYAPSCKPKPKHGEVRLHAGASPFEGQILIYHEELEDWGAVCGDGTFAAAEANVICSQLGFGKAINIYALYLGNRTVVSRPDCQGNETAITDCKEGLDLDGAAFLCFTDVQGASLKCTEPVPAEGDDTAQEVINGEYPASRSYRPVGPPSLVPVPPPPTPGTLPRRLAEQSADRPIRVDGHTGSNL